MILSVVPVTPPETRPLVQLENGQFAVSGINELYRKVIIRNDRLMRLTAESAPAIIINNEKRMLQEAVDGLFDNSSRNKPNKGKDKTVTKSLTDHLKGKTGLFRQNLLGKRVDYSGRSAIVGGPELKLYEAGIPSDIVLKLYEPFIISELIKKEDEFGNEVSPITVNIKDAKKLILRQDDII
jgi:DNA-directed RNA polymerase subunit beta'